MLPPLLDWLLLPAETEPEELPELVEPVPPVLELPVLELPVLELPVLELVEPVLVEPVPLELDVPLEVDGPLEVDVPLELDEVLELLEPDDDVLPCLLAVAVCATCCTSTPRLIADAADTAAIASLTLVINELLFMLTTIDRRSGPILDGCCSLPVDAWRSRLPASSRERT